MLQGDAYFTLLLEGGGIPQLEFGEDRHVDEHIRQSRCSRRENSILPDRRWTPQTIAQKNFIQSQGMIILVRPVCAHTCVQTHAFKLRGFCGKGIACRCLNQTMIGRPAQTHQNALIQRPPHDGPSVHMIQDAYCAQPYRRRRANSPAFLIGSFMPHPPTPKALYVCEKITQLPANNIAQRPAWTRSIQRDCTIDRGDPPGSTQQAPAHRTRGPGSRGGACAAAPPRWPCSRPAQWRSRCQYHRHSHPPWTGYRPLALHGTGSGQASRK
jgi:hypothetical protein